MNASYQLIKSIEPVIKHAGSILVSSFRSPDISVQYKGKSPVTQADLACQAYLEKALARIEPQATFYTEEGSKEQSDLMWIIDPIDGTRNFLHGMPLYAIGIALQHHGSIVFGCVYNPSTQELFWAQKDHGAFLGTNRIVFNNSKNTSKNIIIHMSYPHKNNWPAVASFKKKLNENFHSFGFRTIGSALLAGCYTILYSDTAFISKRMHWWDIAPLICFAQEAGYVITDHANKPLDYNHTSCIIAAPPLHTQLQPLIKDAFYTG